MIIDTLDNARFYGGLDPRLVSALAFLRTDAPTTLELGRHEIEGDRLVAIVEQYVTRPVEQMRYEAHRRYTDVQFLVHGSERMGYAPLATMAPDQPYDPARDVAFFTGPGDLLTIHAGSFVIFGPGDAHAPGLAPASGPTTVRKIVLKVQLR